MKKTYILISLFAIVIVTSFYFYKIFFNQQISGDLDGDTSSFVQDIITKEESGPVANPPASISKCIYKNQTVFYLPPRCCDIEGVLYNEDGRVICSPDGGLRGTGDGRCADFSEARETCEVIWQDSRSYP